MASTLTLAGILGGAVSGAVWPSVLAGLLGTGWLVRLRSDALRCRELADELDRLVSLTEATGCAGEEVAASFDNPAIRRVASALIPARHKGSRARKSTSTPLTFSGVFESVEATTSSTITPSTSRAFAAAEVVCRLDPAGLRWIDPSPAEQAFLGWSREELRVKAFLDIVRPEHREQARRQLLSAIPKGEALGIILGIRTARGATKAIEMNVGARYGQDGQVAYLRCHMTDVTERLRTSRELRRRTRQLTQANEQLRRTNLELSQLKNRYGDLYQNAPVMYFSLDDEGRFLVCNNTLLRALGRERHELIGRPYSEILHESVRPCFAERFAGFLAEGRLDVESRWMKSDGTEIDVWITATAVRNADGRVIHSRSVATDITARKTLELRIREQSERLARANDELSRKNRELDDFTYIVSHDLQQPIRSMIAFSDMLRREFGDRLDGAGHEYLHHVVGASIRMRTQIDDLLAHSRAGRPVGEFGPVPLDSVVATVRADYAEMIRSRGATIRVGPLPTVRGDRERIVQLFGNLIGNGLKYNRDECPSVEITSDVETSRRWTTLAFRDNGIGIPRPYHKAIFQIFRRLHASEEYEGTGAGLAICRKIVEAHGGHIWVESREGEGSVFRVRLPLHEPSRVSEPATAALHL